MARAKSKKAKKKRSQSKAYGVYSGIRNVGDYEEEQEGEEENSITITPQIPTELEHHALTKSSQIPQALRKYWTQRTMLFSYFDGTSSTGMLPLLDEQSWFSVTPESIAARISQRCRCNVVLDACCGAGGNAIQFAFTCQHVLAIDIDPVKLLLAKHNAKVYGVEDKITFLLGDWRDFVMDWTRAKEAGSQASHENSKWMGSEKWKIDIIFLSPPWGGIDYRENTNDDSFLQSSTEDDIQSYNFYPLSRLEPNGGRKMYDLAKKITPNICMYLPRTVDLHELATLVGEEAGSGKGETLLDVEEQWLGNRCKAIACYFGQLVHDTEEE